jgi:DnaK suppressor protein
MQMRKYEPRDYEEFRQLLDNTIVDLLLKAKETVSSLTKEGEHSADPLDRATLDSVLENSLRFRERESRLIRKIRTALQKMDEGLYGICESCGDDIPLSRLRARPMTAYCIQCKTKMENWEKAAGI